MLLSSNQRARILCSRAHTMPSQAAVVPAPRVAATMVHDVLKTCTQWIFFCSSKIISPREKVIRPKFSMKSHKRAFLLHFHTDECQCLNLAEPPRGFCQCFRGKNFVLFRDQSPDFFSRGRTGFLSWVAKIHFNQWTTWVVKTQ